MNTIVNRHPHGIFTRKEAENIAKMLNEDDEDSTYTVEINPYDNNKTVIRVTDNEGNDLGLL